MQNHNQQENLEEMGLMQHLEDLRWMVARCFVALIVAFPIAYTFSEDLINFSRELANVPVFITLAPAEDFLQAFKVGGVLALFLCLPFFLYQLFSFISPGLYGKERRWLRWSLGVSYFLFLGGALFGLLVISPTALTYLSTHLGEGVAYQARLKDYLSFCLTIATGMGLVSQLPIVTVLLYTMGLVSLQKINDSRPFIVVGIFVLAAIITPPDVITQILLGIPTWFIFELSVIFCFLMERSKAGKSVKPIFIMITSCLLGTAVGGGSWIYYKKQKAPKALPELIKNSPKDAKIYNELAQTPKGLENFLSFSTKNK